MALPSSGAISLSDFNTELGNPAGTTISLNSSAVRALIGQTANTEASFSDYYGASSSVNISLTLSSNTNNYNIFNSKGGSYVAGKSNVTLTINSGVTVGSTSTGAYALDTGSGWASGDTVTVVNNGTVKGRGANGGAGGNATYVSGNDSSVVGTWTNGGNGATGGPAFRAQFATTFTNNGSVYGGGGGGGGGGSYYASLGKSVSNVAGGGGGGGAGVNGGSGGSGGTASGLGLDSSGVSGSSGSATSGGGGGNGGTQFTNGGNGGGLGSNGSAGLTSVTDNVAVWRHGNGGSGGTRGYYQVGASFINSGSGIGGTKAGRSA